MEIGEKTINACQKNIDALLEFGKEEMNRVFQRDKALVVSLKIKFAPAGELVKCKASIKFTTDEFDHDTDFTVMEKQGELFLESEGIPELKEEQEPPVKPGWFAMPTQSVIERKPKSYKVKKPALTVVPAFFSPPDCKQGDDESCHALPKMCQNRYLCCLQCTEKCLDRCKWKKAEKGTA